MRSPILPVRVLIAALVVSIGFAVQPLKSEELAGSVDPSRFPLAYKVYDTAARTFISQKELLDRLASVPHILLGEIHDNRFHHLSQAQIIGELVARERKPTVVMEMINKTQTDALEGILIYNRDIGNATPDALQIAVQWDKSGWPAFDIYKPLFATILGFKLSIVPGEPVPGDVDNVLALLDAAPLDTTDQASLLTELKTSHCGVMPDAVLPKVAVAQRKRDAQLALAMQAAARANGDGTVLIAGGGHARTDRGVPFYLRHLEAHSATVLFQEIDAEQTDADVRTEHHAADYIWFTPRHDRVDPCIALRKKFGKSND